MNQTSKLNSVIPGSKICVVTGSRAEYGLLYWFMKEVQKDPELELQVLVTGMHLSEKYGNTWQQIEKDGFPVSAKVEMLEEENSSLAVARSTGAGVSQSANALEKLKPDLLVVLGDRFEAFATVVAATFLKIPVAHFHGGETTEGAFDEALRHCITKMSHFHFTATETYRNRVIQLGENPKRVFNVGAVGLDNAHSCQLLNRQELETSLKIKLRERNLMVTFHPVTLEHETSGKQMSELIKSLESLTDTGVVISHPNADPGGDVITDMLMDFSQRNPDRVWQFKSLGFVRYLSMVRLSDAVVGNSSSGLIEAPFFKTPTVNIGDRQKGRIAGETVVHCDTSSESILAAIERCLSENFKRQIAGTQNPYGVPGASSRAYKVLKEAQLDGLLQKSFFDLPQLTQNGCRF